MDILQQIEKEKHSRKTPQERLYEDLVRDILTGKLPRDSRLNEAAISKKYKISRTPVRETFKRLEMEGLIEYIPNRGEFVKGLSDLEIEDMLFMRIDLEVRAIEWVIKRMSEDEEEELTAIFNYMEFYTKKNDIQKMIDINYAFHRLLYRFTHDRILEKTLTDYQTYTNYCCPPNYFAQNYLSKVLEEHRRIYRAIIRRDIDSAKKAMLTHMERTVKRSNQNLL